MLLSSDATANIETSEKALAAEFQLDRVFAWDLREVASVF
jgi:hypothetical protein